MKQVNKINVNVETQYLKNQLPDDDKFAFAYKITIHNAGLQSAQLLNRYWLITDGNGKKTEVQGAGVVGEQPHILPGQAFQYTSGAILDTPVGTMEGFYEMRLENGETFQTAIDMFSLAVPHLVN
ncbi:Co2+/Mg2+ efflux protein ApaG [uncultured Paraglaciecola sp.]|uniref:Co2+/Mg2+ efflux protein ApaG n=1 Tax=uncultured Paraglaciecola sp. TaxID=1765024 RepID=UPI002605A28A|nr:Co2+/Mg2+ efflux protein ApaG [uncultured Paraglaciecola sp.]